MSKYQSTNPSDRELPDRGAAPFAPDFVSDAVNVARGSIGLASGTHFIAVAAISAVLAAVVALADSARPNPPSPATANGAPPVAGGQVPKTPLKASR